METITQIQQHIQKSLADLNWNKQPLGLYQPIGYTLEAGGKRIRPALLLIAYSMYNSNWQSATDAALALEVFHNFTLLHDDLMDNADQRRGRPSVHIKWNPNTAVLSGDQMMIEAYKLLQNLPAEQLKVCLTLFNQMATEICEGQQYDVDFEERNDVTVENYMEMIRLKTAVLLATALKMGALLAGAPEEDAEALYQFGTNIGLAFQLKDDYLDVYGDPVTFGKPIGGDIACNKKTFMLITAFHKADVKTRIELQQWLACTNKDKKIKAVTEIYNQLGIDRICEEEMQKYTQKAIANLDFISNKGVNTQELRSLAKKLMARNK